MRRRQPAGRGADRARGDRLAPALMLQGGNGGLAVARNRGLEASFLIREGRAEIRARAKSGGGGAGGRNRTDMTEVAAF